MKREFLESLNLDKETVDKIMSENGSDIEQEKAKTAQAKADLKAAQDQLAERDKDLAELKGKAGDAEAVQKQLDALQQKYQEDTQALNNQLAERDYADAARRAIAAGNIKFSSKSAEKAYLAELTAKKLELKDGALVGFDDFHKAQMEADPGAFQTDKPAPTFVRPVGPGGPPPSKPTRASQLAAQYHNNLYGETKKE